VKQQLIKDKSKEVLTSFFGLNDDEPEIFIMLDKYDIELISDALSQSLVKGNQGNESKD